MNWNMEAASSMMPSLMGHMIFGVILGASFAYMRARAEACGCETAA